MKLAIIKLISSSIKNPKRTKISPIIGCLFPEVKQAIKKAYNDSASVYEWNKIASDAIDKLIINKNISDSLRSYIVQAIITDYVELELGKPDIIREWRQKGVSL